MNIKELIPGKLYKYNVENIIVSTRSWRDNKESFMDFDELINSSHDWHSSNINIFMFLGSDWEPHPFIRDSEIKKVVSLKILLNDKIVYVFKFENIFPAWEECDE